MKFTHYTTLVVLLGCSVLHIQAREVAIQNQTGGSLRLILYTKLQLIEQLGREKEVVARLKSSARPTIYTLADAQQKVVDAKRGDVMIFEGEALVIPHTGWLWISADAINPCLMIMPGGVVEASGNVDDGMPVGEFIQWRPIDVVRK